jgi:hypothetical protein
MRPYTITILLLALASIARADNASDTAAQVAKLMGGSAADKAQALTLLQGESDLDRFQTFRLLDRSDATDVATIYGALDANGQAQLKALTQSAGSAGSNAGLQQTGIVSDNDDTAFPTDFTPDGPYQFNGAAAFYNKVGLGTDGKGDPSNIHYVSARLPALFADSRARLKAAGLPDGTFQGDDNVERFTFGGLDGIQQSKIEDINLWLDLHPGQKFVFLGDTLQRDPEVYEAILQSHPSQVEAILIHKAGGPVRAPAQYKGEVFFDNYTQAYDTAVKMGIPQPGAKLNPDVPDPSTLPLPDTDVSALNAAEAKVGVLSKIGDFFKENLGDLFHKPAPTPAAPPATDATAAAKPEDGVTPPPPRGVGLTSVLDQRVQGAADGDKDAAEDR